MRTRKQQMTEGIELQNQENIRTLAEKENYKYFRILEVDTKKKKTSGDERKNLKIVSQKKEKTTWIQNA